MAVYTGILLSMTWISYRLTSDTINSENAIFHISRLPRSSGHLRAWSRLRGGRCGPTGCHDVDRRQVVGDHHWNGFHWFRLPVDAAQRVLVHDGENSQPQNTEASTEARKEHRRRWTRWRRGWRCWTNPSSTVRQRRIARMFDFGNGGSR